MSNLRLLNETTISSSVTRVEVTDVFTSDFDIYQIVFKNFTADGQDNISFSYINASGSEERTSPDYSFANLNCQSNSSFTETKDGSHDSLQNVAVIGNGTGEVANGYFYIFNPFINTSKTFAIFQNSSIRASVSQSKKGIGLFTKNFSLTGFTFFVEGTDNFTGGSILTYGLRVDE